MASNVTAIAAGAMHSLFLKSDGSLWAMGANYDGQLGDGTYNNTNRPEQIVGHPAYNQISVQLLSGGNVSLSFVGIAGTNYALDRPIQPVTGQLGAAGDQSRRRGRRAGVHQHA